MKKILLLLSTIMLLSINYKMHAQKSDLFLGDSHMPEFAPLPNTVNNAIVVMEEREANFMEVREANFRYGKQQYMSHYKQAIKEMHNKEYELAIIDFKMCLDISHNYYSIFKEERASILEYMLICYKEIGDKKNEFSCLVDIFNETKTIENAERVLAVGYNEEAMYYKACKSPQEEVEIYYDKIIENSEKASDILASVLCKKSELLYNRNELQDAEQYIGKAIEIEPSLSFYIVKNHINLSQKKYQTCIDDITSVLESYSNKHIRRSTKNGYKTFAEMFYIRGKSYLELGKVKMAKKDLKKATQMGNTDARNLLNSISK